MLKDERLARIEAYINQKKYAGIRELSEYLSISGATIRRDLEALAAQKKVSITRGGAVAMDREEYIFIEDPYAEKTKSNRDEKIRIAREAAKLIAPGSTVIIDSGTTTFQITPFLRDIPDLKLITNDVHIAAALSGCPNVNVTVLGGQLRQGYYTLLGMYAETAVSDMHVDVCIIGIDAVSLSGGLMISNLEEVSLKRSMIAAANKVVVVCDHTKFKKKAFLSVCGLEKVDLFVTGEEIDEETLKVIHAIGKCVLVVPMDGAAAPQEE
jgi:DeoR/GlpR family transcriptional regulator of sugar metabolism